MSDVISRQAAIDAVREYPNDLISQLTAIEDLPSAQPEPSQVARDIATIIENEQDMRAILDAQPEPHWIPCSERLPEESGQYLITVKYKHVDDYEDIYAEHGDWDGSKWDMFMFGHCGEVESILAWMPLPYPYQPERRTE